MGTLVSWLQLPCTSDMAAHKACLNEGELPFATRLTARRWGMGLPSLAACFAKERPQYAHETHPEPPVLA